MINIAARKAFLIRPAAAARIKVRQKTEHLYDQGDYSTHTGSLRCCAEIKIIIKNKQATQFANLTNPQWNEVIVPYFFWERGNF